VKLSDLDNYFRKFNDLKILVIGDVMIDSYIWGSVERVSPEAPVPVVSIHSQEKRLGGAANVALNIKSMGASPILCSVIGDDDKKDEFIDLLTEEELTDIGLIVDRTRMTTVKTRVISSHQHLLRIDEEIDYRLIPKIEDKFIEQISELVNTGNIDAVVFQDYDKGIITSKVIHSVVTVANSLDIPTLADPKRKNFMEYRNISVFKPNFAEFLDGLHVDVSKSDYKAIYDVVKRHLHDTQGIKNVLITLSELGIFVSDQGSFRNIPAEIRDIADVSGAGDTVISVAGVCHAAGMDIVRTAEIANLAGGLVCEKLGVVPVDRKELYEECIEILCDE
jgi:rfaE bifunctional protein kinase chain/domain